MTCPKCGSSNVQLQMMNESKSGLRWLLIFIPVIGWIALAVLLFTKGHKTQTKALCQSCGRNWDVKK